jgi:ATP-binding cassette subfamily F protein 3
MIGDNGTGKTTILRILNGLLGQDQGHIRLGTNVHIGYYDQEHHVLDDRNTVFEEIAYAYPSMTNTEVRNLLASFLFTGDDVFKLIGELSGGEKGRVSLAKLMLSEANLLILDEPTNHLDMQSKDVLKAALQDFNGTVICVSHDRDFLNGLVEKVYEFGGGRVKEHLGGIYDFLRAKKIETLHDLERPNPDGQTTVNRRSSDGQSQCNAPVEPSNAKLDYAAQKAAAAERRKKERQIAETEEAIAALEAQQAEIEQLLSLPENQTRENFQRYESVKHQIEQKMYEWEILND